MIFEIPLECPNCKKETIEKIEGAIGDKYEDGYPAVCQFCGHIYEVDLIQMLDDWINEGEDC